MSASSSDRPSSDAGGEWLGNPATALEAWQECRDLVLGREPAS